MAEKYGKKVKELMTVEMKKVFSENEGFILSSIENIKATEMDRLRKKMRQSGTRYMVIKNRLAELALTEANLTELAPDVREQKIMGVGVIEKDPVLVAKLLAEFSKANKGFNISKGYLDGRVLTKDEIKHLAELPGREQLLAMVLSMMNAPITGFACVLSQIVKSVLYALKAVSEKKQSNE
ncbi:MAG: 50S ribosomal protein L10 [Candidatus Omnitrophica bacterium]|nr:50S ribosomal protein L10 [Candidatus Omnitrophota bacterium]